MEFKVCIWRDAKDKDNNGNLVMDLLSEETFTSGQEAFVYFETKAKEFNHQDGYSVTLATM